MNFIPAQDETRLRAAASGVLPNGKPVIVNADGTVSVAAETAASIGSEVVFEAGESDWVSATYIGNDKVVIACADGGNSNQGTAVVGTVSGTSISFGTAVVFNASTTDHVDVETVGNSQVLVSYQDGGDSTNGNSRVGTVSGTNISFGTEVTFETAGDTMRPSAAYVSDGKAVLCFTADIGSGKPGKSRIASISGTDVSFGTVVTFFANAEYISTSYIGSDKFLVSYRNPASSDRGEAVVGTISGTNVSFGSVANYNSEATIYISSASVGNNQVVIAYVGASPYYGKSVVATISGTSVTFGTAVVFNSSSTTTNESTSVISRADGTAQISYVDVGGEPARHGKTISGTISGTAITFGTPLVFAAASTREVSSAYIGNDKQVIAFKDNANGTAGTAVVNQIGSTNITAENYVGMSGGAVAFESRTQAVGSATVFEAASSTWFASTFDTSNNKVVFSYADAGNSSKGTAIVGTISDTSISFGNAVEFEQGATESHAATFDTNSNKVVLAYRDQGNSNYGTAIVGTVSGTNISFGSAVAFESASSDYIGIAFDSNSNKVVISYVDLGDSNKGKAIVGTVSGTNISFGSATAFEPGATLHTKAVFDSSNNKVVIAYQDDANSDYGTAVVGTVSGTSISFGTPVVFEQGTTSSIGMSFDTTNNKVVIAYKDGSNSNYGTAIVGTVSGTSISFGTAVVYESAASTYNNVTFDPSAQTSIITYQDGGNSYKGTFVVGTISGTSISFTSATTFTGANSSYFLSTTLDSNSNRLANAFYDVGNSNYGTSVILKTAFNSENRGQVASGSSASVDIIGTVSTNQTGLTPGQSYFVQTDGTITTTAGSPSVFAGTAISATKLLVKT